MSSDRDEFVRRLLRRLDHGEREYGDASFSRTPSDLAGEIEEEVLDIAGWAFILWVRLREATDKLNVEEKS